MELCLGDSPSGIVGPQGVMGPPGERGADGRPGVPGIPGKFIIPCMYDKVPSVMYLAKITFLPS